MPDYEGTALDSRLPPELSPINNHEDQGSMSVSVSVSFHINGPLVPQKSEQSFTHGSAILYLCLAP